MSDGFVIDVDMSDPPIPRMIGPFPTHEAADVWMTWRVGAGAASWNIRPLASPADAETPGGER